MSDLWLGLLLSIPVGLAINLLSPAVSSRLSARTQKSADKRAAEDAAFRQRAADYARDRPSLYNYLLESLIRIAWVGALFGLAGGFFALVGQGLNAADPFLGEAGYRVGSIMFLLSQLVALIGAIIVLNIAREALVMLRQIRAVGKDADVTL